MLIPYQHLAPQTLDTLIEAFVLQEGTDYGERELDLSEKILQVKSQLKKQQAVIVYDEVTQSCNIVSADEYQKNTNMTTSNNYRP